MKAYSALGPLPGILTTTKQVKYYCHRFIEAESSLPKATQAGVGRDRAVSQVCVTLEPVSRPLPLGVSDLELLESHGQDVCNPSHKGKKHGQGGSGFVTSETRSGDEWTDVS